MSRAATTPGQPDSRAAWHGTRTGYNNRGCRCEACKDAAAAYMSAKHKRPCVRGCGRDAWHGPNKSRDGVCLRCRADERVTAGHGTERCYIRGCRCSECRRASADARQRRRRAA